MSAQVSFAENFFNRVLNWPRLVVVVGLVATLYAASFLPLLVKDVRSDAFLAADNQALIYRDLVKEQFGLSDPLVIAIEASGSHGVYTPEILNLVFRLTELVSEIPNINTSRILSLATENNITSTDDGMEIVPFLDPMPETYAEAQGVRRSVEDFPLDYERLVSRDGTVTLLIVEMLDESIAERTYGDLMQALSGIALPSQVQLHVAGEGAVSGYLGSYVDQDAQRLAPGAALVIIGIIILAFGRLLPALLSIAIMLSTVGITLGTMAAQGVPFYVITSALPVILIGISVADAIHVLSHYFQLQESQPGRSNRELIVEAMVTMWRPITLTSLTTIAGFLGLYFAAYMPPFRSFGLFAALGVSIAWLYSLVFLPAAMSLTNPRFRPGYAGGEQSGGWTRTVLRSICSFTLRRSSLILVTFFAVVLLGVSSAIQLEVDDDPIKVFRSDEPLAIADGVLNRNTVGSNTLDIVIETDVQEGLFDPARLKKIEALQDYAATLPFVGGSLSIVDYLKQMNRAMNEGLPNAYRLPSDTETIAQYFLIYSAMSDPTDFEEEIDYDYRMANIRVNITAGGYRDSQPAIESLERYIAEQFNEPGMTATLSGRVNLNYQWIKELAVSHFAGMSIALVLVWSVSVLLFRSELAGIYALIPVAGSVLGVYAVMVFFDITLGMGTSIFAAIAIGLGIDFAIHTLNRLVELSSLYPDDFPRVMDEFYTTTGRALLFNFLAIACGFGVLLFSNVMSLVNFGGIVMLSIGISFLASMILLPALVLRNRPGFVVARNVGNSKVVKTRVIAVVFLVVALAMTLLSKTATAQENISAEKIVRQVNDVDEGAFVTRNLQMTLVDKRGKTRQRDTVIYRKFYDDQLRTAVFYLSPANIRNTAFLTWDYTNALKDDDQWLYLPAMRKVRRISAADRGDYFLGTDFTYEDIKLDGKLSLTDYDFLYEGIEQSSDGVLYRLTGTPKTAAIAKELGYALIRFWVVSDNWMILKAEFFDLKNKLLKTQIVSEFAQVDGILTRNKLEVANHQTGHETYFVFTEVDYKTPIDDELFSKRSLEKGR
jgi:predicted RND superfamily exporter protein/outer membrane lipoprotein-sorting protein